MKKIEKELDRLRNKTIKPTKEVNEWLEKLKQDYYGSLKR